MKQLEFVKGMQKAYPRERKVYNGEHRSIQAERAGMASGNADLNKAAKAKKDEFYTQLPDIEAELKHYKEHFKGKKILCNCDDPFESNFFKYFAMNFNYLGLAKLTATSYVDSPIAEGQLSLFEVQGLGVRQGEGRKPYKIEITEVRDEDGDGAVGLADVKYLLRNQRNTLSLLQGDGDFRSQECIELLKQADIVVTNPPFSLFREYVAQLVKFKKNFIVIGNTNALTYKKIFKLIKEDRLRTGHTNFNVGMYFFVPDDWQKYHRIEDGRKMVRVSTSCWFTTLSVSKHNEFITLYRKYSAEEYPKYDNYDAINVDKVADIPYDYEGVMGVPITFLDKFNPEQFEILGMCENMDLYGLKTKVYTAKECRDRYFELFHKPGVYDLNAAGVVNGKKVYQRILIKRKGAAQ